MHTVATFPVTRDIPCHLRLVRAVLIIDEVSMVDAELFEKIEYIAREVRKNPYPFGGIQLVCCGDFFQLPPVSRTNSATYATPLCVSHHSP